MRIRHTWIIISAAALMLLLSACGQGDSSGAAPAKDGIGVHHAVISVKDYGDIQIELDGDTAPVTVTLRPSLSLHLSPLRRLPENITTKRVAPSSLSVK